MTGVERNKYLYTTCLFLYKVKEITSTTTTKKTTTKNRGGQLYWWSKLEYLENTIDLSQTVLHNVVSIALRLSGVRAHNVSGDWY